MYISIHVIASNSWHILLLDANKASDAERKKKYEAVITKFEFFISQFISNAFSNGIVAFVGAVPWMADKLEYLLIFAWTGAAR